MPLRDTKYCVSTKAKSQVMSPAFCFCNNYSYLTLLLIDIGYFSNYNKMVMKKIILMLLLAAGFQQLKAQSLPAKPFIPLAGGLNTYLLPQSNLLKPLDEFKLDSLSKSQFKVIDDNYIVIYSPIPVVNTSNIDRMPVYNPGEPGVKYTMLVKKVTVINPLDKKAIAIIP